MRIALSELGLSLGGGAPQDIINAAMAIAEKAEGQVSDPQLVKRFVSPYVNRVTQQQLARIKRGGGNESEQGNSGDGGSVGPGPGGSDLQHGRVGDEHDGRGVSPGRNDTANVRGDSLNQGPTRPTELAKSPTIKKPTKQQVIKGIATGDASLEIGKTGSPFENGINRGLLTLPTTYFSNA